MAQQFEAPVCVHLAQVVTGSTRRRVMILACASVRERSTTAGVGYPTFFKHARTRCLSSVAALST